MKNQNTDEFAGYCPEIPEQIFRPILRLHNELKDFAERTELLSRDVSVSVESFNNAPEDNFWRRVVVRNVFVFQEACSYGLKRLALHQSEIYEVEFSPAELALLKEEKYSLDDKGEAHTHDKNFQRFIPNLKFAFKCFAKSHGVSFVLNTSEVPLRGFEEIRNRITHPKQLSDLTISDAEIKIAEKVAQWLLDASSALMQAANKSKPRAVRRPKVSPTTRLNITKDFFVMQPDGNVYQFDSLEEAEKYRDSKIVEDLPFMTPLVFRSKD